MTTSVTVHEYHAKRLENLKMTTAPGDNATDETRMAVLESQMVTLQEGQRQILARLDSMEQRSDARHDAAQQRSDARYDALNSRIDRLFYTMLGLGIAAIGTSIALDRFF